ncbi:proliferating cell nuclear antigen [Conglomerata obtusa]
MVDSDSNSDTLVPDFKNSDTTVLLRKILESISDLVKECEINATEEGLTIQVMDPLHASISDIFISKKNFDTYRCDHSISIGIKLKDFLKILKSLPLEKNYSLKISCKDDADTMSIEYNVENYALKFALMLYTLNCEKYHFPAQKFDVEVEMPTRNFFLVHRIVGTFDEHLLIVAKDKSLIFSQGGETTKSSLAVTEGEDVKMIIGCEMKKEIAMKYVKSIAKAVVLSDNMKICLGESTPVFFEFTLNEGGYIRFFIAPKVDDEE